MTTYKKNDKVTWKWANGTASGKVESVHDDRKEIQSKGETIARNGTKDNPAIVIKGEDGTKILKLASELTKSS